MTDPTPTNPQPREVLPEAWLIREIKGAKATVLAGHMFKSKEAADAAALRLTNGWRLCMSFPVASCANLSRQAAEASAQPGEREAMRKAIAEATISLKAIGEPQPNDPPDALICAVIARSALVRMENALRAPRADNVKPEGEKDRG